MRQRDAVILTDWNQILMLWGYVLTSPPPMNILQLLACCVILAGFITLMQLERKGA